MTTYAPEFDLVRRGMPLEEAACRYTERKSSPYERNNAIHTYLETMSNTSFLLKDPTNYAWYNDGREMCMRIWFGNKS